MRVDFGLVPCGTLKFKSDFSGKASGLLAVSFTKKISNRRKRNGENQGVYANCANEREFLTTDERGCH
jgi:hypothetical protein